MPGARPTFTFLNHLHEVAQTDNLCLAGGVALSNSVANGMAARTHTPFRQMYILPAAGEDGTAVGAAYWVRSSVLNRPRSGVLNHASTGPSFSNEQIREAIAAKGVSAHELTDADLLRQTATAAIAAGKVVGWFQGRMEWGPRALGNRSIVAHPGYPGMKDILNSRIKHREWFRPFAPSILADRLNEYFESVHESPFMLMVYRTREDKRECLSAVNHVDNTGRVQTVTRDSNARYYDLIHEFEKITGLPVVLNTSFNENEPIVCTPREALDCFLRTKMDALAIGNFLCHKPLDA